jgi:hypothetical protein
MTWLDVFLFQVGLLGWIGCLVYRNGYQDYRDKYFKEMRAVSKYMNQVIELRFALAERKESE